MTVGRDVCTAMAFILALMPVATMATAQSVNCPGLRARIDAASGGGARAGQYASALRQQQYELQRTQDYADSIGCGSNVLFNSGPAECEAIESRIDRMRDNVGQLQQRLQARDDDERQRVLVEQYNTYCVGTPPDAATDPSQDERVMPVDPDGPPVTDDGSNQGGEASHRVRALCVRACDGGFFPITDDADSGSIESYDRLCKALCPNAKASLYTAAPSAGIETSVAADGTPYTALPAAFKFQKTFDATCSCKPPHQSWVEALAQAEKLIESRKGDVTVTQTMSDAMARPGAHAAPVAIPDKRAKTARKTRTPSPPDLADDGIVPAPDPFGGDLTRQLRRDAPTL